ncbi:MAG: polyisoprenoid-binding protein YceI [Methylophagaceae bacterium]|jgi:polyisoprenoid-binding protein YceI
MKKFILVSTFTVATLFSGFTYAADYNIDREGTHASIIFKIKHLGYSWLTGRFNDFDGKFNYEQNSADASQIKVVIQTASLDSNHAERDKHLKGEDFLDVGKYPTSTFTSTKYTTIDDNSGTLTGEFSLHGVTKTISFPIEKIGEGSDPWGGYRAGFSGKTTLKLTDYGINYDLGPASTHVQLELFIEGIRE